MPLGFEWQEKNCMSLVEKVVTIVEIEEVEKEVRPEYSDEDLDKLVGFIKNMTTLYDLREEDWNEDNFEIIRDFILSPRQPLLTIYFDGDELCCLMDIPETPLVDMTYFLRENEDVFEVETFHDNIMFGTMHEDIEGSLLKVMENAYAPYFLHNETWPDSES